MYTPGVSRVNICRLCNGVQKKKKKAKQTGKRSKGKNIQTKLHAYIHNNNSNNNKSPKQQQQQKKKNNRSYDDIYKREKEGDNNSCSEWDKKTKTKKGVGVGVGWGGVKGWGGGGGSYIAVVVLDVGALEHYMFIGINNYVDKIWSTPLFTSNLNPNTLCPCSGYHSANRLC